MPGQYGDSPLAELYPLNRCYVKNVISDDGNVAGASAINHQFSEARLLALLHAST